MKRKIIKIDESLCNGCRLCVSACHEGAIQMVDGKARLIRDDYCDGLGNCLPVCPTGAISFEEREALAFDEEAVKKNMDNKKSADTGNLPCGCPSTESKTIRKGKVRDSVRVLPDTNSLPKESNIMQWPVQIQLVPPNAPYFEGADLLIAADCTAYAHPSFNETFMEDKITLIGCPKLDNSDYTEKFTDILENNNIKSVTVVRMEVPCCSGIVSSFMEALRKSKKIIPWGVVTLATDGTQVKS